MNEGTDRTEVINIKLKQSPRRKSPDPDYTVG